MLKEQERTPQVFSVAVTEVLSFSRVLWSVHSPSAAHRGLIPLGSTLTKPLVVQHEPARAPLLCLIERVSVNVKCCSSPVLQLSCGGLRERRCEGVRPGSRPDAAKENPKPKETGQSDVECSAVLRAQSFSCLKKKKNPLHH